MSLAVARAAPAAPRRCARPASGARAMTPDADVWSELNRPAPESVAVHGTDVRKGSRVRLRPRAGGDIMDAALAGRVAIIEGIDQSLEGTIHLAVTLEDDPGRDLGDGRFPGHRFFFRVDEVEPLERRAEVP